MSKNIGSHDSPLDPSMTRRRFIQRTATVSAVTVFGLAISTPKAAAETVEVKIGTIYTYTGPSRSFTGATLQSVLNQFYGLTANEGITNREDVFAVYNSYTHEIVDDHSENTLQGFFTTSYNVQTQEWTLSVQSNTRVEIKYYRVRPKGWQ